LRDILAKPKAGLERALDIVRRWALENGLDVNVGKSKVLVVKGKEWEVDIVHGGEECKGREGCHCHYRMGEAYLARVKTQKYLGVVHQEDGGWEAAREDRRRFGGQKGAMVRLMGMDLGLKPDVVTTLVNAMVRTSLLFGAGLWNLVRWRKGNVVIHRLARRMLNVNRAFPSLAARGDLGWWSVEADQRLARLRLAKALQGRKEGLVKDVFEEMQRRAMRRKNWNYNTTKIIREILGGGEAGWTKLKSTREKDLKEAVGRWEQKDWARQVQKERGLAEYSAIKKYLRMENYLGGLHGYLGRSLITKVRAGVLPLGLRGVNDLDWRKNQEGVCGFCWEQRPWWHGLLECPGTAEPREEYLRMRGWGASPFLLRDLMKEIRGKDRERIRKVADWILKTKDVTDEWMRKADEAWERERGKIERRKRRRRPTGMETKKRKIAGSRDHDCP
jgi:hypothetical protein